MISRGAHLCEQPSLRKLGRDSAVCALLLLACLPMASAQSPAPNVDQYFAMGVKLQQQEKFRAAQNACEAVVRLAPSRFDAWGNLGQVYLHLGNPEKAADSFGQALKLDPGLTSPRFYFGIAQYQAGNCKAALDQFESVVEMHPSNRRARQFLGVCLLKLGLLEEGIEELEPIVATGPHDISLMGALASGYIGVGQLDKARPLLDKLAKVGSTMLGEGNTAGGLASSSMLEGNQSS